MLGHPSSLGLKPREPEQVIPAAALRAPQTSVSTRLLSQWLGGLSVAARAEVKRALAAPENLAAAWPSLALGTRQELQARFGAGVFRELSSLTQESDPELLAESWLNFAMRQERAGRLDLAASVYGELAQGSKGSPQRRAQVRLDAIAGHGAVGTRVEHLLGQFCEQSTDPAMLGGMMLASTVFQGMRLFGLSRLLANPEASWLTRGTGAKFLASSFGFAFEVPTMLVASKGLHQALGAEQDWSVGSLGREGMSLGVSLLFLKSFGALSRRGLEALPGPVAGNATGFESLALHSREFIPNLGMMAGIYLGTQAEQALGLRPKTDRGLAMLDSLAFLFQFQIGGHLSRAWMGSKFSRTLQEFEVRGEAARPRSAPQAKPGNFFSDRTPQLWASVHGDSNGGPGELALGPSRWHHIKLDPMWMTQGGESGQVTTKFLEQRLTALLKERLQAPVDAPKETADRYPALIEKIVSNFAATPGVDPQRYYELLRESRIEDARTDDGQVTTRIQLLEVATSYLRHAMEMNPLRRDGGSLFDHLTQEAFERTLTEGNPQDFDALIRVLAHQRKNAAVEDFLRERQWLSRYQWTDLVTEAMQATKVSTGWRQRVRGLYDQLVAKLSSLPKVVRRTTVEDWKQRLSQAPLSNEAKESVFRYLAAMNSEGETKKFYNPEHNYILLKPDGAVEQRVVLNAELAVQSLADYLQKSQDNPQALRILEDAIRCATGSAAPLLHFDRLFKVLATGDLSWKLSEISSKDEFDWGLLLRYLDLSKDETGYPAAAAKLNGTIFTGYVWDSVLAEKFAEFYDGAGTYLHPVESKVRLSYFRKGARALLEEKIRQGKENYDREDVLQMLFWRPTKIAAMAHEAIEEKKEVDFMVMSREQLLALRRSVEPGRVPEDSHDSTYYGVFIPASKSKTGRPTIAIAELDPSMTKEEKIARAVYLAAFTVHEFEHYLHSDELVFTTREKIMRGEMRSWLEEMHFLMNQGELTQWHQAEEVTPYGFGVHLRNQIDKDYIGGPRDLVVQH